jgi:hypothetical protein
MKNKITVLATICVLLLTFSCKKDAASAITSATSTDTSKELFSSSWSVSNSAWYLDWGNGNLTGSSFTSWVHYSAGGTCTCTTTITGTETAGTYLNDCSVGTQVSGTPTTSTCDGLDYSPTGSYTNVSGILTLCRSTGSCTLVYH